MHQPQHELFSEYKINLIDEMYRIKPAEITGYNVSSDLSKPGIRDWLTAVYRSGQTGPAICINDHFTPFASKAEIRALAQKLTELCQQPLQRQSLDARIAAAQQRVNQTPTLPPMEAKSHER